MKRGQTHIEATEDGADFRIRPDGVELHTREQHIVVRVLKKKAKKRMDMVQPRSKGADDMVSKADQRLTDPPLCLTPTASNSCSKPCSPIM